MLNTCHNTCGANIIIIIKNIKIIIIIMGVAPFTYEPFTYRPFYLPVVGKRVGFHHHHHHCTFLFHWFYFQLKCAFSNVFLKLAANENA